MLPPNEASNSMEIVLGVLLTGLGALLGYLGSQVVGWQEKRAKRTLLTAMLRYELRRIKDTYPLYKADQVFHRDPLRFSSLDELALGNVLTYRKDDELIRELLLLRIALARYNDFVSVSNLTQNFHDMPDEVHEEVFRIGEEYHRLVRELKWRVLKALPKYVGEIGGFGDKDERSSA